MNKIILILLICVLVSCKKDTKNSRRDYVCNIKTETWISNPFGGWIYGSKDSTVTIHANDAEVKQYETKNTLDTITQYFKQKISCNCH